MNVFNQAHQTFRGKFYKGDLLSPDPCWDFKTAAETEVPPPEDRLKKLLQECKQLLKKWDKVVDGMNKQVSSLVFSSCFFCVHKF